MRLSKAHNRPLLDKELPKLIYCENSSYLRTTKSQKLAQVGGGKRSKIQGFTKSSRRRLLETISKIRRDAILPNFVTLTYPNKFPTVERSKRDLKVFIQRLKRKYPLAGAIWKLEPQERGAPHFHLLIWGASVNDLLNFTVENWYEIAGDGDINHKLFHSGYLKGSQPCVAQVRSWRGVWSYASKYLGKTFEVAGWGKQWTGRYWGVIGRENIPMGQELVINLEYKKVCEIMRLQRRFMNMRKRKNLNSLKTFCDADQWVSKLLGVNPKQGGYPLPSGWVTCLRSDTQKL